MNTPYLIQRGRFEKRQWKMGIDALLKFDYMGSSEFEYGAKNKSLSRIRENIDLYTHFNYVFQDTDKTITVFCLKEKSEDVCRALDGLADGKFRLKEYSNFDAYIIGSKYFDANTTDFWWDIENDYFFWKFNDDFTSEFIKALKKQ